MTEAFEGYGHIARTLFCFVREPRKAMNRTGSRALHGELYRNSPFIRHSCGGSSLSTLVTTP